MAVRASSDLGSAVRVPGVVALAVATTVAAHVVVTAMAPGLLVVALAAAVAGATVAALRRVPVLSGPLAAVLAGQLACHVVLALTQPAGCLASVGRAAWAGVGLARWGVSADCDPAQLSTAGSPQQLALLAVVSVVPLLLLNVVAAVAGATGLAVLERAVDVAVALLGIVLAVLPGAPLRLPVSRRPRVPAAPTPRPLVARVPLRPLVRRGPPGALPA
jgi:hypothetical protein